MKPHLQKATPDDVKILMTNARLSTSEVLELYALRWQIELFFKELKSTFGFAQYRFRKFTVVQAWVELALSAVMFVEEQRARRLWDRRLSAATRRWW
ncbi:MAG: transposase [Pirellulales bacterium]